MPKLWYIKLTHKLTKVISYRNSMWFYVFWFLKNGLKMMAPQLLKGLEDGSSLDEGLSSPCSPPNFETRCFFTSFTLFLTFPRLFSLDTKERKLKQKFHGMNSVQEKNQVKWSNHIPKNKKTHKEYNNFMRLLRKTSKKKL